MYMIRTRFDVSGFDWVALTDRAQRGGGESKSKVRWAFAWSWVGQFEMVFRMGTFAWTMPARIGGVVLRVTRQVFLLLLYAGSCALM